MPFLSDRGTEINWLKSIFAMTLAILIQVLQHSGLFLGFLRGMQQLLFCHNKGGRHEGALLTLNYSLTIPRMYFCFLAGVKGLALHSIALYSTS